MKKKPLFYLTLFIYFRTLICACDANAPVYKCSLNELTTNKCMVRTQSSVSSTTSKNTFSLQNCKKSETCYVTKDSENKQNVFGTCHQRLWGFAGDKCQENGSCNSNYCDRGKCKGLASSSDCTYSYYGCEHGLTCASGEFCIKALDIGSQCQSSYDCNIDSACGKTSASDTFKCVKLFSLPDGAYVPTADNFDSMACSSGYAFKYSTNVTTCSTATRTNFTSMSCTLNSECAATVTDGTHTGTTGSCICSLNGFDSYCDYVNNDDAFKDWLSYAKSAAAKYNNNNVGDLTWSREYGFGDPKLIYKFYNKIHPEYQGADDCAIRYNMNSNHIGIEKIILIISFFMLI